MKKEIISDKQAIYLIYMFTLGSTVVLGTGGDAKMDMWFAVMLAMLLGLIIAAMYSRILYNFPQKDIFDINKIVFGKFLGNVFNLFFIFYSFHLTSLVMNNFTEFISTVGLPDTPKPLSTVLGVFLLSWAVKAGLEVLGRCSGVFTIILISLFIGVIALSINRLNFDNIRPFMYEGISPILKGTFSAFSFPFAENVIFLMLFSSLKNEKSSFKVFSIGLILSGLCLILVAVTSVMFVGTETLSKNYFPTYIVVSRISVGEFLQRIETVVVVTFLLAGFIKICCCLISTCKGVAKLFGFDDYRFIVTPITLMVSTFSFIVYNNIIESINWAPHVYPIYAFLFQVILPLIIFIASEIKIRKSKEKGMR